MAAAHEVATGSMSREGQRHQPTRQALQPLRLRAESRRITERIAAWNDPDLSQLPGDLLLLTEWPQFAALDWAVLAPHMRQPAWLFDARAVVDAAAAHAAALRVRVVPTAGEGRLRVLARRRRSIANP